MHQIALPLLIGLIAVALAFDFLNGLHDAANSIATVVGTRLISPVWAVGFAAFFNFAAYFLALQWPALHKVADTIGKGLIDKDLVTPAVVFGALVGAMFWNIVTWLKGIPSSSSHALVGGLIGAGVAHAGISGIQWSGLNKTLIAIVLSPMLGLILTMGIMLATSWLGGRASARGAERTFRGLHLVSAGAYSLGHGLNDAQKTMGIITVLLYSTGYLHGGFHVPHWVALSCYVAIGLGTLTGGWRIIETMGTRITKLNQHQGFSASAGGSVMLFAASYLGIPVSTTHTITGCVIGAGAARRASAVRWGIARNVMIAWIITIPASAAVAALFYYAVSGYAFNALIVVEVIALAGFAMFAWREVKLQPRGRGRIAGAIAALAFVTAAVVHLYALADQSILRDR
jgi:PiT family inorganic phosphate transporter